MFGFQKKGLGARFSGFGHGADALKRRNLARLPAPQLLIITATHLDGDRRPVGEMGEGVRPFDDLVVAVSQKCEAVKFADRAEGFGLGEIQLFVDRGDATDVGGLVDFPATEVEKQQRFFVGLELAVGGAGEGVLVEVPVGEVGAGVRVGFGVGEELRDVVKPKLVDKKTGGTGEAKALKAVGEPGDEIAGLVAAAQPEEAGVEDAALELLEFSAGEKFVGGGPGVVRVQQDAGVIERGEDVVERVENVNVRVEKDPAVGGDVVVEVVVQQAAQGTAEFEGGVIESHALDQRVSVEVREQDDFVGFGRGVEEAVWAVGEKDVQLGFRVDGAERCEQRADVS